MINLEIKYFLPRFTDVETYLSHKNELQKIWTRHQEDIYFNAPEGRLKLRKESSGASQLIFYHRPDCAAVRESQYQIYQTADSSALESLLKNALGIRLVVKKRRTLYLFRNVRIHLDRVDSLGDYLELESVVSDAYPAAVAAQNLRLIQQELESNLSLMPEPLGYADLLQNLNKKDPKEEKSGETK